MTTIREPIHKSIRINCFEREIVDSRYFQRLHFVLQNSTTYVAYPANKNSRFVHSLGVADVAGDLLVGALSRTDADTLRSFLDDFEDFLEKNVVSSGRGGDDNYASNLIDGWKLTAHGQSGFTHHPHLKTSCNQQPYCSSESHGRFECGFLVDTLWLCVRICGLVHDIGHMPMSHSFEGAMNKLVDFSSLYPDSTGQYASIDELKEKYIALTSSDVSSALIKRHGKRLESVFGLETDEIMEWLDSSIPLHERRSLLAFEYIYADDKFKHNNTPTEHYRNLVFEISFLILYASTTDFLSTPEETNKQDVSAGAETENRFRCPQFLRMLKTIVAGELDADRIDYTIRDGHACGSPIGQFDYKRIVENAILIKNNERYHVGYYFRSLSGIEQFFSQRYEGYKRLIYHRTSARTETCLQELISRLFHWSLLKPTSPAALHLKDFGYLELNDDSIESILPHERWHMSTVDDYNLRSMFTRQYQYFEHLSHKDVNDIHLIAPIVALLEVVVFRDFRSIWSPFKLEPLHEQLSLDFPELSQEDLVRYMTELCGGPWKELAHKMRLAVIKSAPVGWILITNVNKQKYFNKDPAEKTPMKKYILLVVMGDTKLLPNVQLS